ncbi:MAG TPA: (E)-4-hydroxy-3-methylbut-2-enyl-diphosphate synthase, partial [Bacteroidia bacterium]|nr:(E)-4-hydroxy-3-methylbut-2-enyl-diphosphate synthase [Bacteroidia bacterium]
MSTETGLQHKLYCDSLTAYTRRRSRVVNIGDVPLGGTYPIRVQSMTTTDTMDTIGTVEQSIRMIEAGCEYVRITAPSLKEAENLQNIKNELRKRGYKTPLVADIHFTPNAAEVAARIVEKVRVNPGNYADKKKFEHIEYTDETYITELERIRQRFVPLVKICKEHGTAMRIGANHGSLSDRIMSRYGDTPLGMVESALEFLRICEEHDFKQIVLSMKSSNPLVMVQAYRLLIEKMYVENMNYPLHLGVTEAGEGEDGRIKSAAGIGTLLEDGIGDTVRVSLTEDPEFEIPVAKMLVSRYANREKHSPIPPITQLPYSPIQYTRRETREPANIGGKNHPRVIADLSNKGNITQAMLFGIGHSYNANSGTWKSLDQGADYVFAGDNVISFTLPEKLK